MKSLLATPCDTARVDVMWLRVGLALVLLYFPVCGLPGLPFGNGGRYASVLAGPLALLYLLACFRSQLQQMVVDAATFFSPFIPFLAACLLVLVVYPEAEVGDPFSRVLWSVPIVLAAKRIGLTRPAVFSAAALGAAGYFSVALFDVFVSGVPRAGIRVNEVIFAQTAALCAGMALVAAVCERKASLRLRTGWFTGGMAGLIAVAMTGSRGPLLATLWLVLLIGVAARRRAHWRAIAFALLGLSLVMALVLNLTPVGGRLQLAAHEIAGYYTATEPALTSIGIRLHLWSIVLSSLPDHWLLGYGYSTLQELASRLPALQALPETLLANLHHFHADWAHALMAGGLVLLAGLACTMAALLWQARSDAGRSWLVGALLVFGLTDIAAFRKPTLTLFVAAYGLLLVARDDTTHEHAPRPVPG